MVAVNIPELGVGAAKRFNTNDGETLTLQGVGAPNAGAGGTVQEIRFAITTAALQTSNTVLPTNTIVIDAELDILSAYDDGTTISVGHSMSPAFLMSAADSTPSALDLYERHQDTTWPMAAPIQVTISGAPAAGSGFCIVRYVQSPNT
jgi:hypothetical protein